MMIMKIFNEKQIRTLWVMFALLAVPCLLSAQAVLYQENFGVPSANTLIQNYSGWQDTSVLYTGDGTCDVRASSASSGYGGASGGGNVMINDTVKWFQISRINTAADTNLSLYCGLRKTASENGSNLVVEASADSLVWTRLYLEDTLPAGTGTSGWYRVRYRQVPSCPNLHLRFSNLARVDYRLDDLALVVGDENVLETVATPTISPSGGTYYEPQTVTIATTTAGATIYYTMDGSTPSAASLPYLGPLTVNNPVTVKAMAVKAGMYDSEVASASFVVLDTNSLVILPLDLSDNSGSTHWDITQLPGFRGYHLGSSYSDGSVKFETAHAGQAALVAHLDNAPGKLAFDLKGKNGGSNPAAYEGIQMEVAESADGQQWSTVALLTESDISTDGFAHFDGYVLDQNTRYVRWKLLASTKGNTQLNNIAIGRYSGGGGDSTTVISHTTPVVGLHPNPTLGYIGIYAGQVPVESLTLLDLSGHVLRHWTAPCQEIDISDFPRGLYMLRVQTAQGVVVKKVVRY